MLKTNWCNLLWKFLQQNRISCCLVSKTISSINCQLVWHFNEATGTWLPPLPSFLLPHIISPNNSLALWNHTNCVRNNNNNNNSSNNARVMLTKFRAQHVACCTRDLTANGVGIRETYEICTTVCENSMEILNYRASIRNLSLSSVSKGLNYYYLLKRCAQLPPSWFSTLDYEHYKTIPNPR